MNELRRIEVRKFQRMEIGKEPAFLQFPQVNVSWISEVTYCEMQAYTRILLTPSVFTQKLLQVTEEANKEVDVIVNLGMRG